MRNHTQVGSVNINGKMKPVHSIHIEDGTPTVTLKFRAERKSPPLVVENNHPSPDGINSIEWDDEEQTHIDLYEESPGIFREPNHEFGVNSVVLIMLMQAGVLKDVDIPITEVLDFNESTIRDKGHLEFKVVDGRLKIKLSDKRYIYDDAPERIKGG